MDSLPSLKGSVAIQRIYIYFEKNFNSQKFDPISRKTRKNMDSEESGTTKRGRGRGRTARGRGTSTRARGRGRGRGRKAKVIESDEDASPEQPDIEDVDASIEEKPQEPETIIVAPADSATDEKENEIVPPTSEFIN